MAEILGVVVSLKFRVKIKNIRELLYYNVMQWVLWYFMTITESAEYIEKHILQLDKQETKHYCESQTGVNRLLA